MRWVRRTFQAPWNWRMKEDEMRLNTTSPCWRASCTVSRVSKVPENTRNSHLHVCMHASHSGAYTATINPPMYWSNRMLNNIPH